MNEEKNNSLEELNSVLKTLFKHLNVIIITTIIFTFISAIAVFVLVRPKYQSTAELIVNQKLDKNAQLTEQQQIQSADLQLVNTYKSILSSQTVGNTVKKSFGEKQYKQTQLSVNTDPTSQVLSLDVTAYNPSLAAKVANRTAEVFKKKVKKIMNIDNVYIISKARANEKPVSPKKKLTILAGFFVGMLLGIFLAFFKEYSAKTIESEDYITDELGLTNLGTISDIDMKKIKKDIKH